VLADSIIFNKKSPCYFVRHSQRWLVNKVFILYTMPVYGYTSVIMQPTDAHQTALVYAYPPA